MTGKSTHGESRNGSRIYSIWQNMIARCNRPGSTSYRFYGARGVSVCELWTASYVDFRDWSVANGYDDGLQIDRIDTNGNYGPENCRWVSSRANNNNRIDTKFVVFRGETMSRADFVRTIGAKYFSVRGKLERGWSADQIALHMECLRP